MFNAQAEKLALVTGNVLIVGVDVAKKKNVARFIDTRGFELCRRFKFRNDQTGILSFVRRIIDLEQQHGFERTVVGMEPSGHYWEPLAYFLKEYPIVQVFVNPYHVKCSKEIEDNSPDKMTTRMLCWWQSWSKTGTFSKCIYQKVSTVI